MNQIKCYRRLLPENTCEESFKEKIHNLKSSGIYNKLYNEKISNLKIYKDLLQREIQNTSDDFNILLVVLANKERYSNELLVGNHVSLGILHLLVNDSVRTDGNSVDSVVTCSCVEIRKNCLNDLLSKYVSVDNKLIKVRNDWVEDENNSNLLENTFRQRKKKKYRHKGKKEKKEKKEKIILENKSEQKIKPPMEDFLCFKLRNRIYVHPQNIQSLFEIFSAFSDNEEKDVFYRIIEFHIESKSRRYSNLKEISHSKNGRNDETIHYSCIRILIVNNIQDTQSLGQHSLDYFFEFFLRMKESFDINQSLLYMKTESQSSIVQYLNYLLEIETERIPKEHVVSFGLDIKFLFVTSRIKRLQTINQFVDSFLKKMNQVYYSMQKKTLEYRDSEFFKLEERITMLRCLLQYYEGLPMENKCALQKYLHILKLVHFLELSIMTKEQAPSLYSHENNIFRMVRHKEFEKVNNQICVYKHNEKRCKKKEVNIKKNCVIEDVNKELIENHGIRNHEFCIEGKDSALTKEKNTLLRIKVHEKGFSEHVNKIAIFNNTLEEECIDTRIHCPQQNNKRFCQDVLVGSCMSSEKNDSKEESSSNGSTSESDAEAKNLLKNMKKNQKFINKVSSIYDTNKKKNKKQKKKELDKKAKNLMKEVEGYLGVPSIPLKKKDTSKKKSTEEEGIDDSWNERVPSDYKDRKEESTKLKKNKKVEETSGNHLDNLEKMINTQITQLLKKKMEYNPTMSKKCKEVHKVNVLNVVVDSSSSLPSSSCGISSSSDSFSFSSSASSSVDSPSSSIIPQQSRKPKTKRNKIKYTQKNTLPPSEKGIYSIKKYKEIEKAKDNSNNNKMQTKYGKPNGPWNIQNFQNWKDKNILKQMLCNSNGSVYSFSTCGKRKRKKKNDSEKNRKSSEGASSTMGEHEYMRNKENESIRNTSKENSLYRQPQNIPYSCIHDPTDLLKYHNTIQEFLKNTQAHFLKEQYKEDSHELELLKRIQFAKKVLKEYSRLIKIHYNIRIDDSLLLKKALKNHSKSRRSSKGVIGSLSECDRISEWKEPSMKEERFDKSCSNMNRMETYSLCEKDRDVFSSYEHDKEELKHLIRQLLLELKNCVREKRNANRESVCFHNEQEQESFCNRRNSFCHGNRNGSNEADIKYKHCTNDCSQTCMDTNHTCFVDERKKCDTPFMCNGCKNKKQEHSFFEGSLCNICSENIRKRAYDEHEMNNKKKEINPLRINDHTKDIESTHRIITNGCSELITDKILKEQNRNIDFFDGNNELANPKCRMIDCNEGKEKSVENNDKQNKTEQAHIPHFKLYLEFDGMDGNMSSKKITSLENTINDEKDELQMKRSKEYKLKDRKTRKEQEDESFREIPVKEEESTQPKKKYDSPRKTRKEEPISSSEKYKIGKRKTRKTIHRMSSIVSNELKKKELAEEKKKKQQLERNQLHLHNRKKGAPSQGETAMHEENKRKKQNRNKEPIIDTCYNSTPDVKSQFIDSLNDSLSPSSCERQAMHNLEKSAPPNDELEYGLERQREPCKKSNEIKISRNPHDVRLHQIPPTSNTNDFQELKMDFFFDDNRILFPSSLKETASDKKGRKSFHELCKIDGKETAASSNFSFLNSPEGFIDPQQRDQVFEKKKKIWDQMKRNMKVLKNIGRRERHKLRELLKRKKKLRSLLERYPNVQTNETEALQQARKMSCKIENLEKAKILKLRKIKRELERIGNLCEEICENPFLLQEKKKHETTLLKEKRGDTYETLTNKKKCGMKPNSTFHKHTNRKFRKNRNNSLYEDPSFDEYEWSTVDSSGMDLLLSNSSWNSFGTLGKKGKHKNQYMSANRKSHTNQGTYRNKNRMNRDHDSDSSNSISSRSSSSTSFLTNKNKQKKKALCQSILDESRKDRINNSEKPSVINTHSWHTEDDVFLENLEEGLKRNSEIKCPKEVSKETIPREIKNTSKESIKLMTKRDSSSNESNEKKDEPIYKSDSGDIKKYSIYYENMSHLKSREDSNSSEGNVESVFKSDPMNSLVRMNPNENKVTNIETKKKENHSESGISVTPDFKKEFHKMSNRKENPAYYVKEYPAKTNIVSATSRSSAHSRYSTLNEDDSSRNTPLYKEENQDLQSEPTYHYSVDNNSESLERHTMEPSEGVGEYAIRIKKKKEKNNKKESSILQRRANGSTVFSSVIDDRALTDVTPFQHFSNKYNKRTDIPTYVKKDNNGNINRINIKNFRFPEKDLSRNRAYNNVINKKIVHLNVHK